MSVKSRIRSTTQQLKLLTDYMATHPTLAQGEFTGAQGRIREQRLWEELQVILREHGPDKSVDQWKVTWRDLRRKARVEGSQATGNATALSDQTKKILGIMGMDGSFNISGSEESGIGSAPSVPDHAVSGLQLQDHYNMLGSIKVEIEAASDSQQSDNNEDTKFDILQEIEEPQRQPDPPSVNAIRRMRPIRVAKRLRQQMPRARANQFLEAELESNHILRDIFSQLAIANRHRARQSRFTFKEKLWQMRKDLFK